MILGERQVAPNIRDIRRDHVARYEWVAQQLSQSELEKKVLDVACGVGYGSQLVGKSGMEVIAIDKDAEAISYARQHYYDDNVGYIHCNAELFLPGAIDDTFDAAVAFEFIEHVEDPLPILKQLRRVAKELYCSVPNQEVFPYLGHAFHFRHYTATELSELLQQAGWRVFSWYGQTDTRSDVIQWNMKGRTVIVKAVRDDPYPTEEQLEQIPVGSTFSVDHSKFPMPSVEPPRVDTVSDPAPLKPPDAFLTVAPPEHVVILGLGPSLHTYMDYVRRVGSRKKAGDEVWAINALGDLFQCDRIFHMDDVRIQEIRAKAKPDSNIANMLVWMKKHPGPIYTSVSHPDYPGTVALPIEDMINNLGKVYFNNTAAWALAYAIHIGVKKVSLYGCDYTYPDAHHAEKGRGCLEFWLGFAAARGIDIRLPKDTTLMDAMEPEVRRYYGYDAVEIRKTKDEAGKIRFNFVDRPVLPTAEEIEAEYDHTVHPNRHVRGE
jgi:SAM-dependent methyltransferase